MFELTLLGAPTAMVGALFLFLFSSKLLSAHKQPVCEIRDDDTQRYVSERLIPAKSALVGLKAPRELDRKLPNVELYELIRGNRVIDLRNETVPLMANDVVLVKASASDPTRRLNWPTTLGSPSGSALRVFRWSFTLRLSYRGDWPARCWGRLRRASRVRLVQHVLPILPAKGVRKPLRTAFVSDLHLGPTTAAPTVDRALALATSVRPDLLLLGGDFVFLHPDATRLVELEQRLAAVPARKKIAVLGNHDLWTHHRRVEDALHNAGVQLLVNEAVNLEPEYPGVAIVGLDEPWTGQPDARACLAASDKAHLRIALCHSPEGLQRFEPGQIGWMLCGHTHGGHIALPDIALFTLR